MSSNLRGSFHWGFMSVLLRSSSEEPGERLGIPGGGFQMGRVATARQEPQARSRNALGHAPGDVAEFGIVLAGEEQHRREQPRQLVPQRWLRARSEVAQRGGE